MSAASPTLLPDLAVGDLVALRALLSGRRTRDRLDARLDTEKQDTLLTWAARHGQAEAVRLLLEAGASVGAADGEGATALSPPRVRWGLPRDRPAAPRGQRGGRPSRC